MRQHLKLVEQCSEISNKTLPIVSILYHNLVEKPELLCKFQLRYQWWGKRCYRWNQRRDVFPSRCQARVYL